MTVTKIRSSESHTNTETMQHSKQVVKIIGVLTRSQL
jgi:hypothetical protein